MDLTDRVKELGVLLRRYQDAYYKTGRSEVSDSEYDRLFDELLAIENAHPSLRLDDSPTMRVGSDLSSDFPEVSHSVPVLSLDKAYSAQSVIDFAVSAQKNNATNLNLSFVLEEKIDGFSIVLYYEHGILKRAVTRGNGFVGNDVTANVRTIKSVPLRLNSDVNIAVRGEVYLRKDAFENINNHLTEPYANPRNLAAGTIRRNKSSETALVPLDIFVYEGFWAEGTPFTDHIQILSALSGLGFPVDSHLTFFCKTKEEAQRRLIDAGLPGQGCSFDDIPTAIESASQQRPFLGYEIDGLVLKVNELAQREAMGYTEHHPRWAVAYKFNPPVAQTDVCMIDVQVGRTGRLTPMARVNPVQLSGSVIRNVTLHNQDYVNELEIAVGDTVSISKRGDVIPAVESVIEKNSAGNTTWKMPTVCPVCGSPIEKRGAHHFCTNRMCRAQILGRLEFFCDRKQMDIEGLGPKTIEVLYETGKVHDISDLFSFDYDSLVGIDGFGPKKIQGIKDGLAKTRSASFRTVLQSLGIPDFGKKAVDCMTDAGYTSIEQYLALTKTDEETLAGIDQIGPATAALIVSAFTDKEIRDLINELRKCGFSMSEGTGEHHVSESGIFSGQTWCVTGTFDNFQPREKAMEEIIRRGGKETGSVSRKTTCLLAGKNAGSKLAKAREYGVRIVNEEEFIRLIRISEESEKLDNSNELQMSLF